MNPAKPRKRKLFFALWPDEPTRSALVGAARDISAGGVRMPPANLHVTLVFVGYVDGDTQACMERAAAELRMPPFDIRLDRVDSFRQKILWVGSSEPPPALFELQQKLAETLAERCGYQPEARPYRPHVTIERKLAHPLQTTLDQPLVWHARDFALVESIDPVTPGTPPQYRPLRKWPLLAE